jgi:hypothetical protein
VLHPLDISFGLSKPKQEIYNRMGEIKQEVQTLISMLSLTQTLDDEKAKAMFDAAKKAVDATALSFIHFDKIDYDTLNRVITVIEQAKPAIRKKVLQMVVICLSEDGNISYFDMEILHAVAATLRLPLTLGDY